MEALTLAGEIKSREDVIKTLEGAGFEIARTTKQSISIKNPEESRNYDYKGLFMSKILELAQSLETRSS